MYSTQCLHVEGIKRLICFNFSFEGTFVETCVRAAAAC